jgi:mannose-1-phosphate guanylyltransferase
MLEHYYALIMAGGGGTRLWPLSRANRPKQLLKLLGERSMFELAVDRLKLVFPPERIFVVTSAAYAQLLRAQRPELPEENFILEPEPRNTAPAIGLAAVSIHRRDPQATMVCVTADHFIGNELRFRDLLVAGAEIAAQNYLVTLGIRPTFSSTGYGYIQRGEVLGQAGDFPVFRAVRFKEKPNGPEADAMVADGLHSWNSGMFVWRVERVLQEFARLMPDLYRVLTEIEVAPAALEKVWSQTPKISIDYGIMEGAAAAGAVAVIPAEGLNWSDIGSWDTLLNVLPPDSAGNVVVGTEHLALDSSGLLIHVSRAQPRLVATIGLSDLVVIDTEDALFICPRERAQEVRAVVEALKKGRTEYL